MVNIDLDTNYTPLQLAAMGYDHLVTTVESVLELNGGEMLDKALHDLEVFRENHQPEMEEIIKLWGGNQ